MKRIHHGCLRIVSPLLILFFSVVVLAQVAPFPKKQNLTAPAKIHPSFKRAAPKEPIEKTEDCLKSRPSPSARKYVQDFVDRLFSDSSKKDEGAQFYCALYQGLSYRYTTEVPEEYRNALPQGFPTSMEFVSPVEKCFGTRAKPFCVKSDKQWRKESRAGLEERMIEFSWVRGTVSSPFVDTEDYLQGLGFLMSLLDQKLFSEKGQKAVWKNGKR